LKREQLSTVCMPPQRSIECDLARPEALETLRPGPEN
jgi:hypothetical protein